MLALKASSKAVSPSVLRRGLATATLPDLTYDYSDLEPVICAEIMQLHHLKHHQSYVQNFNAAEEKMEEASIKNDLAEIIRLQPAIKFNGGGERP